MKVDQTLRMRYDRCMLKALFKTMRPRQWHKNVFVFAALVFDIKLFQAEALARAIAAFVLFCLISSTVYIINDVMDREQDRQHPTKRLRPIPAGKLPVNVALAAAALFTAFSVPLAFLLDWRFGVTLLGYLVLQVAYSVSLKHIVIMDVLAIAAGFVLRVLGGVFVVVVARFSPWLYVCMTLLSLFLAIGKRRHEVILLQGNANTHRRVLDDYTVRFLDEMIALVTSTTVVAYSLYTFSAPNLPANHSMMLTIPFVLYALFRYLYLIHVRGEGGAPDELVLKDRPLLISVLLWGAAVVTVLYWS
ncbi:MAG: decaprenyl-phosphate phosphoribosyltransferase [Anaerolineae bacterium]|nr:decaprenyl-phosphate phosphoribosyltransferase [Anaerolineae bacterium]